MNTLINQYLQSMDFFVSYLDEEFKETVRDQHRDVDYNNFSEGEKMRIDLLYLLGVF